MKIEQEWRQQAWPEDHYSNVTIELCEGPHDNTCSVSLKQINIPKYDKFDNGNQRAPMENIWREVFIRGLKQFVGYGLLN